MLRPTPTPAPVLAEVAEEEPEETPIPEEENPLKVFLDGFYQAYAPDGDALHALSKEDSSAVDEALALEQHILRLKQLFSAQAGLWQNPNDNKTWDGILFGVVEGTGSVVKTMDGCTFTCTLTQNGSIEGSLKGGTLFAQWMQQDGTNRSGTITKTDTGYTASVNWDGENVLLQIENNMLSFGTGMQATATASSLPVEQWANWHFKDGKLAVPQAAATSSSIQEGTQ